MFPSSTIPTAFQYRAFFFVCHNEKFVVCRNRRRVVCREKMSLRRESECKHQRGSVTDCARITERLVGVCEGSIGIAKEPQRPRPKRQRCHTHVLTKTHRQRTMLDRGIERDRLVVMCAGFCEIAAKKQ